MKIVRLTLWTQSLYLRKRLLRLGIVVIGLSLLNSCSTYRAERLKNKSYKAWQQQQLEQGNLAVDADKLSGKL